MNAKTIKTAVATILILCLTVGCSPTNPNGVADAWPSSSETSTGIAQDTPRDGETPAKEVFFAGTSVALTPQGIFHTGSGPIRFTALDTGATTVLCDKPDCRHEPESSRNPDPSCLARINGVTAFAMFENRQVFAKTMDGSAIATGIYTADANGANRKLLARIDSDFIFGAHLVENLYVLVYVQNYEIDENGLLERLEKSGCGLAIVDLKTNKVGLTEVKYGYDPACTVFSIQDGMITYAYSDFDEPPPYDQTDEAGRDAHAGWRLAHQSSFVYRYDVRTAQETLLLQYSGKGSPYGMAEGFFVEASKDQTELLLVSPSGGKHRQIARTDDGFFTYIQTCEGWVYFLEYRSREQRSYHHRYRVADGVTEALGGYGANPQNYLCHVFADVVYLSGMVEGGSGEMEYAYSCMLRGDFLAGDFDKSTPLLFPNRQ